MLRSTPVKIGLAVIALIGALAALRFKPWQRGSSDDRGTLEVGYLPVT
jgi:hypothetical protein